MRGSATGQSPPLRIDVRKLRAVLDDVLAAVEAEHGAEVLVERDHYWLVELACTFADDLHQPGTREDDLGVGQLSDDIESVAQTYDAIGTAKSFVAPWHDLEHAVGLLRALAWIDLPR